MKLLLFAFLLPVLTYGAAAPKLSRPETPEVDHKAPETVPTELELLSKEQLIMVIRMLEQEINRLSTKVHELENSLSFHKKVFRHKQMVAGGISPTTAATASASSPAYQAATQASADKLSNLLNAQKK